ncbi:MAG: hypothetical protein ACLS7Z_12685 [Christensenellales bacterium]
MRRISNHITKKVADRLTGMFKTEREPTRASGRISIRSSSTA